MAILGQDFLKFTGDSYKIEVLVDNASFDLSSYQAYWAISESPGSSPVLVKTTDGDFSQEGGITWVTTESLEMEISLSDTLLLQPNIYYHELTIKDPVSGRSNVISVGDLDLRNSIFKNVGLNSDYLLDEFTNAEVAYSLRKLSSSHTGPVIRVRRSVDDAEMDINFNKNSSLDVSTLLNFVGNGNGYIKTLYTIGGTSNATNDDKIAQPIIVENGKLNTQALKPAIKTSIFQHRLIENSGSLSISTDQDFTYVFIFTEKARNGNEGCIVAGGNNASAFKTMIERSFGARLTSPTVRFSEAASIELERPNIVIVGRENNIFFCNINGFNRTPDGNFNNSVSMTNLFRSDNGHNMYGNFFEIIKWNYSLNSNIDYLSSKLNSYYNIY